MRHIFLPLGLACLLGITAAPLTADAASPALADKILDLTTLTCR